MVCKLIKINMYNLNKVSKQWYLNIVEIIASLELKENNIDMFIWFNMCIGKFIIPILNNNDVPLENIDISLIVKTK